MLTLLIDAMEQHDVAVFDVLRSYLQTEIPVDQQILLCVRYEFLYIVCEVNPDYKPYVQYENGNKVLYVKVPREIYGCIESALLWFNLYVKILKDLGFSINKYDRRVANKMIDWKQRTIVWYVNYNNLLNVDPNVVTDILEEIKKHFGDLVIIIGDTHDFFCMTIKIGNDKKVEIIMKHQIEYTVNQFTGICYLRWIFHVHIIYGM